MTEIRSMRNKKKNQLVTVILFAILLAIFFATIGFKLLINTSLFIANITSGTRKDATNMSPNFVLAPELLSIPDATSSAQLAIHGTATDGSELSILVNGENQKELTVDGDTFDTNITLQKGSNELYVEMRLKKQNIFKKSDTYTILYQSEKPKLQIDGPANGSRTGQSEITVSGSTDPNVTVRVNGSPAIVNADGKFSSTVRIHDGENKITITATNRAGTVETQELTVIFESN